MARRWTFLPHLWVAFLSVVLLGPALRPGYVLSYDMVWVPQLAMRTDFLGFGTALPRAVPSDAVVAGLNVLLPGMLLQKLVLLGVLLAAGIGALRLVGRGTGARMVAATVAVWNPFVVERLWFGHWTVLVGYAALPWLVDLAVRARRERRVPAMLFAVLPVASLSASAGVASAVLTLVLGVPWETSRSARRTTAVLVGAVVAANAPWLVAGFLHASIADAATSTRIFGLHADGLPAPLAALSLGGIWNAQVVPGSRAGPVLPALTLLLLVLAAVLGFRRTGRRLGRRTMGGLVACWALGYLLALVSWASPGSVDWLAAHLPGGGLLRDGTRSLALCLPLLVALVGDAVDVVLERGAESGLGILAVVAGTLAPVVLIPDAVWGVGGQLEAVDFPRDWGGARAALAAEPSQGDVLVLPLGSYRAPSWNGGRTVIDPLGRYLTPNFVVDDSLSVSGTVIPGEDPRYRRIGTALAGPDPAAVARSLGDLGVATIAIEKDAARTSGALPAVRGHVLFDGPTIRVERVAAPLTRRHQPAGWIAALAAAWAAYCLVLLVALSKGVRNLCVLARRGRGGCYR